MRTDKNFSINAEEHGDITAKVTQTRAESTHEWRIAAEFVLQVDDEGRTGGELILAIRGEK